jgi:hypothetical protein
MAIYYIIIAVVVVDCRPNPIHASICHHLLLLLLVAAVVGVKMKEKVVGSCRANCRETGRQGGIQPSTDPGL